MKIEEKIYISIGFTVFLTIAYYYVYAFVDLYLSKLCKDYVCFEFPPYADIMAIWIAIIGLYFLVTTLDSWKNQDKYNNAKNRIALLNDLQQKVSTDFSLKLCAFYEVEQKPSERKVFRFDYEKDYVTDCFNAYLDDNKILDEVKKIDRENYHVKNCLYQNDFDIVIDHAFKYISKCCNEVRDLQQTQEDTKESYDLLLNKIYRRNRREEHSFQESLRILNEKLNKFIE